MLKNIAIGIISSTLLIAAPHDRPKASTAERGTQFYEFEDTNSTKQPQNQNKSSTNGINSSVKTADVAGVLKELLEVAKEQRDIQQKILDVLNGEFNPTPQKVVINGKECVANSSADCFVMPLTKDAQKIPVIKNLLVNPSPETARDYLQWQAKYLNSGPFKIGRSFEYAMNTYGNEAYPINLSRPDANSNTNLLSKKREKARTILLNEMYKDKSLALYIFLQADALDYFSIRELSEIVRNTEPKTSLSFVFKSEKDKKDFFEATKGNPLIEGGFNGVSSIVNSDSFDVNNIHMTPTYVAAYKENDILKEENLKKQAVAIGRVSKDSLNEKIYEWLEQEEFVKRGALSDYKIWNIEE
ncbi:hypothetical protein [Sulfurimonas sp.]|uniref:hypothetical protein n=1 Tax=Sulfurimonas sp. TaxID=2022749 RepID=UPI0025CD4535|nr:hypothetical protein [Sulfurimonas sp.]MBW6487556.1 hypothetical protein [Sulfurimonas sp.]